MVPVSMRPKNDSASWGLCAWSHGHSHQRPVPSLSLTLLQQLLQLIVGGVNRDVNGGDPHVVLAAAGAAHALAACSDFSGSSSLNAL